MRISHSAPAAATGRIAFADGLVLRGQGVGPVGEAVGEVCFNTAMTGYQEILTDPSYAGQIVTFTFPHIGNVGANDEDGEDATPAAASAAVGAVFRDRPTSPSNYRARLDLQAWMKRRGVIGVWDVDTRALTALLRENGAQHAVIAHNPAGRFDEAALVGRAKAWNGLVGRDLASDVTTAQDFAFDQTAWRWPDGYGRSAPSAGRPHVVVIDFGVKKNILRLLADNGARVTVVPARAAADEIFALAPDGVVLSNGPGDPAATFEYAGATIRALMEARVPVFGICLGHQMLALALGARTVKMPQGHHGANHPVKCHETGRVEIVSMNHGFAVDADSLPERAEATFTSLFDGTNCGLRVKDAPAFSVQHHPEASPGPQDSFGVFTRFVDGLRA